MDRAGAGSNHDRSLSGGRTIVETSRPLESVRETLGNALVAGSGGEIEKSEGIPSRARGSIDCWL